MSTDHEQVEQVKQLRRELRSALSYLRNLCTRYEEAIHGIDNLFKVAPQTPQERESLGESVARMLNVLEHDIDAAKHFGLGLPLGKKLWNPKKAQASK